MRSHCCQQFRYPCTHPNEGQEYTQECESGRYWKGEGPTTGTVAAGTIFSPNCAGEANAIAAELAYLRAVTAVHCIPCCFDAVCVFLPNASDVQHLAYWTVSDGILFTQDVEVCVNFVTECEQLNTPDIFFQSISGEQEIIQISPGECATLSAGILYWWGLTRNGEGRNPAQTDINNYTIGWECDMACPPWIGVNSQGFTTGGLDVINSFPAGIARCVG